MSAKSKGGKPVALKRECQNCEFFVREITGGPACALTNEFVELTGICKGHVYRQACRVCGCSHNDPCEEGCWWVEPDLCSSCAPPPRPSRRKAQAA